MRFHKNQRPWNKGLPTTIKRCKDCGIFMSKTLPHICKSVDKKGPRYCITCGVLLRNKSWERHSKICGRCGKIKQRKNERILRQKLIDQFGGECIKCGYNKFIECLEFHHINKSIKKNRHCEKDILKHPDQFELLCNRCHREKEVLIKRRKKENMDKIKITGNFKTREIKINGNHLFPQKSQDVYNHSPDGFAWGNYGGSGPSQLALAILLECSHKNAALKWYQDFKRDIISGLPPTDFEIEVNMDAWLKNKIKEESFNRGDKI